MRKVININVPVYIMSFQWYANNITGIRYIHLSIRGKFEFLLNIRQILPIYYKTLLIKCYWKRLMKQSLIEMYLLISNFLQEQFLQIT